MGDTFTYQQADSNTAELEAIIRATALAFGGPLTGVREWLDFAGRQHLRVLRDDRGGYAASLLAIPMGQHFGARAVPMQGVAGVAVPPEARGRGLALGLMREQVREAAREGVALSCLYASTQALYRQVGYEQAGLLFRTHLPLRTIGLRERSMPVRELAPGDDEQVRACYRSFATVYNGTLERGPYIWGRVTKSRDDVYTGFGVFDPAHPDRLEGYFYMTQRRKPDSGRHDLALSDIAFSTPRAGARLLGLLADFATVGDDAVFYGGPMHPICTLMPQQRFTSNFIDAWMVRINAVGPALELRGYPSAVRADLGLVLTDELVPENAGGWRLSVRDGRGALERVGDPGEALWCDIRALASVYSGLYSASQAKALGMVEGSPAALAAADAIFAGHTPWMPDRF